MDYIFVPIILIFGFGLKSRYKIFTAKDHILLDQLFFYHMIMSFIFYIYLRLNGGDSFLYWNGVKNVDFSFFANSYINNPRPTSTMWLINYIPSNLLNLDFFTGCILYGVFGYWGMLYILLTLKKFFPLLHDLKKIKILNFSIFPTLFFMPNFHFWSAGVGKDTLSFFVICLCIYALLDIKKKIYYVVIPVLLLYFIRPHILLFLFSGLAGAYLLKSKLLLFQKVFIVAIGFVLFLPLLNSVLEFANIDAANVEAFDEFSSSKARALSKAGSGVDLGALPYPLQVLTFLYRPLFFDAHNVLALLASVESLIWIILSVNFFRNQPIKVFKHSNYFILGGFLFWIIGALAFAPSMSNLGIIIRERNMFLPGFIIFAVAGLYNTPKFRKYEWWLKSQVTNSTGFKSSVNKKL
ncbi:hypothetical protein NLM59_03050 [Weeksellaceae bacterium KMM 9724]|uniref:hypothetical protein n=1 Tax=Profundicola chukchiensis TaxID=2961959 RepID=UPI002437B3F9|nr:hypothetical protein [Profundicola chukchiensis]MDG4949891.1 hypothetical protein [Profundicola chukchiensis]